LSWEILQHPPDLLFIPAHVIPLVHPKRTLVTIHDLGYRYYPEAHPWKQRYYLDLSTRWNARKATHILADSHATREALMQEYGTPADKITVVYPGYDSTLQAVHDPAILKTVQQRYGISDPYILYLGRIQPRKNLLRLVGAFAQLSSAHRDLSLVLAGPTGWLAAPIRARVQNLGLAHRVQFPGYVAESDKAALLSGARIFAFPSLYEGFGFPVLEAQACGVPVLTSNTTSLPEVAGDGALFVDPRDENAIAAGLRELLESASLRQDIIQYGAENLQRFSWKKTAHTVAELMKALVKSEAHASTTL
jgi:glycosyltransferase involved in cell wall biosynthesis